MSESFVSIIIKQVEHYVFHCSTDDRNIVWMKHFMVPVGINQSHNTALSMQCPGTPSNKDLQLKCYSPKIPKECWE